MTTDPATAIAVPGRPDFSAAAAAAIAHLPGPSGASARSTLRAWITWCTRHHIDPWEARRVHIEAWGRWLREHDTLAVRTVAARIGTVAGVYTYAYEEGWIHRDIAKHVRRPRYAVESTSEGLTRAELLNFLTAADLEPAGPRATLWLLALNGTRIGETLALDVDDLATHGELTTITLHRKGDTTMRLSLAGPTLARVQAARGERTTGPLLTNHDGRRLTRAAVATTITRAARLAGITRRVTPHSLRHTFVTLARDAGIPDRDIMASTGHKSPQMIEYYDRARAAVERNATHRLNAWLDLQ